MSCVIVFCGSEFDYFIFHLILISYFCCRCCCYCLCCIEFDGNNDVDHNRDDLNKGGKGDDNGDDSGLDGDDNDN